MRNVQLNMIGNKPNLNLRNYKDKRPVSQSVSIKVYVMPHSKSKSTECSEESDDDERLITAQIKSLSYDVQNVAPFYREIISYTLKKYSKNKYLSTREPSVQSNLDYYRRSSIYKTINIVCDTLDCNKSLFMAAYLFNWALNYLHSHKSKKVICEIYEIAATTCIFMAMKICEIYPPELSDLLDMLSMSEHLKKPIIGLESEILASLKFNITYDSYEFFLNLFSQLLRLTESQQIDCLAILEYGMLYESSLEIRPSQRAAAAINLLDHSQESTKIQIEILLHLCHLTLKELNNLSRRLLRCVVKSRVQGITFIYEKYTDRYGRHIPWLNNVKNI